MTPRGNQTWELRQADWSRAAFCVTTSVVHSKIRASSSERFGSVPSPDTHLKDSRDILLGWALSSKQHVLRRGRCTVARRLAKAVLCQGIRHWWDTLPNFLPPSFFVPFMRIVVCTLCVFFSAHLPSVVKFAWSGMSERLALGGATVFYLLLASGNTFLLLFSPKAAHSSHAFGDMRVPWWEGTRQTV